MSDIYFFRHGQASWGRENYDRLSELGYRQAEILGDYLVRLGLTFDAVYSGSMERQEATAKTVMAGFPGRDSQAPHHIDPDLNEYRSDLIIKTLLPGMIEEDPSLSGAAAGMIGDSKAFLRIFEPAMLRWASGRHETPGAETWLEFTGRIEAAVAKIISENGRGKTIAVFTSGGPISAVMRMALGLPDETAIRLNWLIRNTSFSSFKYGGGGLTLSSFNSVAHLEARREPDILTYK